MPDSAGNRLKLADNTALIMLGRVAAIITLPILAWGMHKLDAQADLVTKLSTDLQVLQATISINMSDRYRGSDANRDFQLRDLRLSGVEHRLDEIERVVRKPP